MKKASALLLLALGLALAVLVGQVLTSDAGAVVVGVAMGVVASIPVSWLLVALLRRERESRE